MAQRKRKTLSEKYPVRMTANDWQSVYESLAWDRHAASGKNPAYDATLGDRPIQLRKQCAHSVIRLVLHRLAY